MTSFDSVSRQVLAEFLQTAVVIDDAAYNPKSEKEPAPGLKSPSRVQAKTGDTAEGVAKIQSAHSLDTRLLVDTFASKGLVCAVIAPRKEEPIAARLGPVAERCDIVIIDWQIFDDDGERTRTLIEELCNRDNGSRLRLLCVYSGEVDLEKISDQLTQKIEGLTLHNDDKYFLRKDHVIVTILGKSAVPADRIADTLLDRFSVFTKGLLANAVLAALTGIRRNVHRVIRHFDADLDQAYLSHRIMSNPVDSVESEILSLIAAELESVVHQCDVSSYINNTAIAEWIDTRSGNRIQYDTLKCKDGEGPALLKQLIEEGADDTREGISPEFKKVCKLVLADKGFVGDSKLTALLGSDDSKNADRRFAMLSTLETRYENLPPQLTLGTVIHDGSQYLLCLMPRCDSARVPSEGRDFLFVKLMKNPASVDLIVEDNDDYVDLGVSRHPYDTVIYRFTPGTADKPITSRKGKYDTWEFVEHTNDKSVRLLRWVAELKPQIAQAFVNEYATQVCRVGATKSQWLHRLKKKEENAQKKKKTNKA